MNFIYWRLGVVFLEEENYEEAHEYLMLSLEVAKHLQLTTGIAHSIGWLAVLNERIKNFKKSRNFALDAKEKFTLS